VTNSPTPAARGRPRLDRDLSWLAFNHRVLQEAADPGVPLFDRLAFLAIFSSNLDEFFRVRVASVRARLRDPREGARDEVRQAAALLQEIRRRTLEQQEEFGRVFRDELVPALAREGIHLVDETGVPEGDRAALDRLFAELVAPELHPIPLTREAAPFLRNRGIYLVAELAPREEGDEERYGLVEIPGGNVPRFVALPRGDGESTILFVDDVIRLYLPTLFPGRDLGQAYSIKLSRDAELYLEEELPAPLGEAIRRSLGKRETGLPTRFLFDRAAPAEMIRELRGYFGLADADLVEGGRYHNLHDLHTFPRCGRTELAEPPLPPLPHPELTDARSVLDAVAERDRIVHLPYQAYEPILRFLREAAADASVEEVWATLYRVAPDSAVVEALASAALAGKRVTAIVEVQARFDEAANLAWSERLESAGVRTIHGVPGLKVHAKLLLVVRRREGREEVERLACLSTGNFNERTARFYADHVLLTAHPQIAEEVHHLFRFMAGESATPRFERLLVAPVALRQRLEGLLEAEVVEARAGRPARAVLKMNSLEDPGMIEALYRASQEGVQVELIVRGICCLLPGVTGLSANIEARGIVDRFLEHGRAWVFHAAGDELCYLASADWMTRNLDHRVEVAFPLLDPEVRRQVRAILRLQLDDDRKARRLEATMSNPYLHPVGAGEHRAQMEIYRFLRTLADAAGDRAASQPVTDEVAATTRAAGAAITDA
jgi:polyphosphate kinase